MKTKLILAFFIILVMNLNSKAQDGNGSRNQKSIIDYKTELALNDTQVEKIKTIQKEYFPKMKEARNAEDRAAVKNLNDERKAKIELILTPEQLEKWKVIKQKMKDERLNK